ncbi:MAG: polysaccharide deacetylase family protein, partial [Acidobacteriota bacterium]
MEEWFHVPGHPVGADSRLWAGLPPRLPYALRAALDLLASLEVRATFFVLGWAASRHRAAVRRISEEGHEVACHGNLHRRVDGLAPSAFRRDLREGRQAVEDVCGRRVRGFRAPMWSMGRNTWPYEVLAEEGFTYSSSRLAVPFLGGGRPGPPGSVAGVCEVPALRSPW